MTTDEVTHEKVGGFLSNETCRFEPPDIRTEEVSQEPAAPV